MKEVADRHHDEELEIDDLSSKSFPSHPNPSDTSSPVLQPVKPAQYVNLPVSQEVRDVLKYVTKYTPINMPIETPLRPFESGYIPCIGEVDAFLKVPRPDGQPEVLGLSRLDEPSIRESDPSLVTMQLRAVSKTLASPEVQVRAIERAEDHPDEVDKWVQSIEKLHKDVPPPRVQYSQRMPDVESLMQVWPAEVEGLLGPDSLEGLEWVDLSLEEYLKVLCAILGIPVGANLIDSAHLFFTLFIEVSNNQHFQAAGN